MNEIASEYSGEDEPKEDFEDIGFASYISQYFPRSFPIENKLLTFWGLREFLLNEEREEPILIMGYVINAILEEQVCIMETIDYSSIERIPEREYCIAKMEEEMEDDSLCAEDVIYMYECLDKYAEYYFNDIDFELLDMFSLEELALMSKIEELGLGDIGNIKRFLLQNK